MSENETNLSWQVLYMNKDVTMKGDVPKSIWGEQICMLTASAVFEPISLFPHLKCHFDKRSSCDGQVYLHLSSVCVYFWADCKANDGNKLDYIL